MTDLIVKYYDHHIQHGVKIYKDKLVKQLHDRNNIFINNILSLLNIKLECIETNEKQVYYYDEYKICYQYDNDNDYLYFKIIAPETIFKIVITKLMYSINYVKNGHIILVTFGSIQNIICNPKICSNDDLYYNIISEIYCYYTDYLLYNSINIKKIDNILGLYCYEDSNIKYFKHIQCDVEGDSIRDDFDDDPHYSECDKICILAGISKKIIVSKKIITTKCYIDGLYLNVEIYDENNMLSRYQIPLYETGFFIEKQYNINNDMESCDLYTDNCYMRILGMITSLIKNNIRHSCYYSIKCILHKYINQMFNIINDIDNLVKNNLDNLLNLLSSDCVGDFSEFAEKLSIDSNLAKLFDFLFRFIHDEKNIFGINMVEKLCQSLYINIDEYDIEKYNELFNDNISMFDVDDYNKDGRFKSIDIIDDYDKVKYMVNKIANYFIDFHKEFLSTALSENDIKMVYNNMLSKKKTNIIDSYNSDDVYSIMEHLIKYRDYEHFCVYYDEDKYWLDNETESYYEYKIGQLYKYGYYKMSNKFRHYEWRSSGCFYRINGDFKFEDDLKTRVNSYDNASYIMTYEYGNNIKHMIIEYGNSQFKTSSTKINKEKQNIVSVSNEKTDKDSYEYKKIGENKNKYLVITKNLLKNNNYGIDGFKAGITERGTPCIIVLRIFPNSVVAFDKNLNKYRTNRCSVKNIYDVKLEGTKLENGIYSSYKIKHYIPIHNTTIDGLCPICCSNEATQVAQPCKHNLCLECWMDILSSKIKMKCPYCDQDIENIDYVPSKNIVDTIDKCDMAYSFVSTHRLSYKIGETIEIKDFDKNLDAVCKAGIHFHLNIEDTYKWFEYLLIPTELAQGDSPIELSEYQPEQLKIDNCNSVNTINIYSKKFTDFNNIINNIKKNYDDNCSVESDNRCIGEDQELESYDFYEFMELQNREQKFHEIVELQNDDNKSSYDSDDKENISDCDSDQIVKLESMLEESDGLRYRYTPKYEEIEIEEE